MGLRTLPRLPFSADRNLSPRRVSRKREYSGVWPETFDEFSLRLRQLGVWRPSEKREKARILRAFRDYGVIYLRLKDWLAGDAVLIAPVSTQIPCYQGILQGILRF
jgi:hypothetical protein